MTRRETLGGEVATDRDVSPHEWILRIHYD